MDEFGLPDGVLSSIAGVIASIGSVKRAAIYGSRAKGSYRPNSDIDIMLYGDSITLSDLANIDCRLDDLLLPWQIDLTARCRVSSPTLLDEVDRWGKTFFKR